MRMPPVRVACLSRRTVRLSLRFERVGGTRDRAFFDMLIYESRSHGRDGNP